MDDVQKTAINAKEDISFLLKAFSHPARLEILTYLYNGPKEFVILNDKIDLSKTALMKHLDVLMEAGMIIRKERGKYEISQDGKDLYVSVITSYRKTQLRFMNVQKEIWSKYIPKPLKGEKMETPEFLVKNPAKYIPGWLSYNSCLTGILTSLGKKMEKHEVAGYDGTAFFINVLKGFTCPSGPSNLCPMKDFYEGLKDLGWVVKEYCELMPREAEYLPIDYEKFETLFDKVKEVLHSNKRPVILWGIPIPEYGIVNGHKSDSYIVSTFRKHAPEYFGEDKPIKFNEIIAPGRLQLLYFEKSIKKSPQSTADKNAITRALRMLRVNKYRLSYISGPKALLEWANVLEGDIENISYHGNSYVAVCALESSQLASKFLDSLYHKYKGKQQGELLKAAVIKYQCIEELFKQFVSIFPFSFDGDLEIRKRKMGAELLRKINPELSSIVETFITTIEVWE